MQHGVGSFKWVGLLSLLTLLAAAFVPVLIRIHRDGQRTQARAELLDLKALLKAHQSPKGAWPGLSGVRWSARGSFTGRLGVDVLEGVEAGTTALCDPWGAAYCVRGFGVGDNPLAPNGALLLVSSGPNQCIESSAEQLLALAPAADDLVLLVTSRPLERVPSRPPRLQARAEQLSRANLAHSR